MSAGLQPGEFQLGSLESRAAARALAERPCRLAGDSQGDRLSTGLVSQNRGTALNLGIQVFFLLLKHAVFPVSWPDGHSNFFETTPSEAASMPLLEMDFWFS